jgi:hypothetical protein
MSYQMLLQRKESEKSTTMFWAGGQLFADFRSSRRYGTPPPGEIARIECTGVLKVTHKSITVLI